MPHTMSNITTGMIVIRGPTGADNKADLTVLNRHFLADFDIKTKQTQPIRGKRGLANISTYAKCKLYQDISFVVS